MDNVALRPIAEADAEAVDALSTAAFADLAERIHEPWTAPTPEATARSVRRFRHVIGTDPDGGWIADAGGEPVGASIGLRREGIWGLSLLVVHPDWQGRGLGRALLERAVDYGRGCRGGIIVSSADPPAIRGYGLAGFTLVPCVQAAGAPRRGTLQAPRGVREGGAADLELAADVDRAIRGASHGVDLEVLLAEPTFRMLVVDDGARRGYAFFGDARAALLAATDAEAAQRLLWAMLAEDSEADWKLPYLSGDQGWAIEVALAAGLRIEMEGPLFVRGELGPMAPYIPSGAYL
ncbi:MAG TPA: GNAT family N-acetyltransferase [Egibacteraceae bacterium]|nr:GNAT family N-acetyltransferase [Egibacteraceae bacterium]